VKLLSGDDHLVRLVSAELLLKYGIGEGGASDAGFTDGEFHGESGVAVGNGIVNVHDGILLVAACANVELASHVSELGTGH